MDNVLLQQINNFRVYIRSHGWGLYQNAFYIFGANILPGLFGAIFWWLASRFYSPSQVGIASAIISAGTFIAMISRMGLDTSIVRYLPNSENQLIFINTVFTVILSVCILLSGAFLVLIPVVSPELILLKVKPISLLGFILLSISTAFMNTFKAIYVSKRQAIFCMYTSFISNVNRIILLILGKLIGWISIAGAVTWGVILSLLIGYKYYIPSLIDYFKIELLIDKKTIYKILPYSFGNFLADLAAQAPITILPLMILNSLGRISNGHAYVALVMGSTLTLPGLAISRSAFAEGANRLEESGRILKKAALVGGITTFLIAIVVISLAPWILMLYGQSYADEATSLLRWLAVASPFNALVLTYYTMYRLNNQVKHLVGMSLFFVVITIFITKIGMPFYGISAAGMGLFLGNLLNLVAIVLSWIMDKNEQ